MDSYNLIVLDATETFASRLRAQLREMKAGIDVFWADGVDGVNEICVNRTPHAYLISAAWSERGVRVDTGEALRIPLEEARTGEGAPNALYRSDPIPQSAARIFRLLVERTRVIGVFGAGGGAGNTSVCMALAQGFARLGQRVFVLSLESCIAQLPFTGLGEVGLAEVLLALDNGEGAEKVIANACHRPRRYNSIDSFSVNEYDVDRAELRDGDLQRLLAAMRKMNRWDVILVDLESRMDDVMFEVWEAAAKMVLVIPQTVIAREKLTNVERDLILRQKRGEAELEKLVPVFNFAYAPADGSVTVAGRPVTLAIRQLKPESVRGMTSEQWFRALGNEQCQQMFEPLLQEVSQ